MQSEEGAALASQHLTQVLGATKEARIMDDLSERMTRLEDALADLATLVAEGTIPRPSFCVGSAAEEASERFVAFLGAVRRERGQSRAVHE
ncbi:MAG TPA: hypothetical protein VK428_04180 [Acidimicrobiales bacterium]|nr:hypothetical protein [Acidimicrobiales bacterium]